jgi:hypothetical protein
LLFCLIPTVLSAQPRLTFYQDIAPIVWHRCSPCHRAGQVGPFSLMTYDDVRRHAAQIATVTARRIMPPWKPVHGKGDFQDERRLTDAELGMLQVDRRRLARRRSRIRRRCRRYGAMAGSSANRTSS